MGPPLGRGGNEGVASRSPRPSMLQWGRLLEEAEISGVGEFSRHQRLLQWGRLLEEAEMRPIASLEPPLDRFNGAASWKRRK